MSGSASATSGVAWGQSDWEVWLPVRADIAPIGENRPHGGLPFSDEEWAKILAALRSQGWAELAALDAAEAHLEAATRSGIERRIRRCRESVEAARARLRKLEAGHAA